MTHMFSALASLPGRYRRLRLPLVVVLLAAQFCFWQAVLHVEYDDAPRNLHWGLFTAEQPRFLLTALDDYERGKGFPPDPAGLAPNHGYGTTGTPFHPWWGPAFPLLFGGVWLLTHSYGLLQQLVPLAAGASVLLAYTLATKLGGRPTGFLAAVLFALMPLVREYGVISYVEGLSALVLLAALWCFVEQRTAWTVLLGTIAVLCKRDTAALYVGTCVATLLWDRWRGRREVCRRHGALALAIPALAYLGWITVTMQRPPSTLGGFSFSFFLLVIPQMVELFFYIPWFATLPTLALLGWLAWRGFRRFYPSLWSVALGTWLLGGLAILLIYAGTHGAGNSPRVIIPALPPLAILAAGGLEGLHWRWRNRLRFYLISLFAAISIFITLFQYQKSRDLASYRPAFTWLSTQPQGFVLTESFWSAILYARQPGTWFEFDSTFEHNIMRDPANFARYVTDHHIRYVILPPGDRLAAAPVRQFLTEHGLAQATGETVTYRLY